MFFHLVSSSPFCSFSSAFIQTSIIFYFNLMRQSEFVGVFLYMVRATCSITHVLICNLCYSTSECHHGFLFVSYIQAYGFNSSQFSPLWALITLKLEHMARITQTLNVVFGRHSMWLVFIATPYGPRKNIDYLITRCTRASMCSYYHVSITKYIVHISYVLPFAQILIGFYQRLSSCFPSINFHPMCVKAK